MVILLYIQRGDSFDDFIIQQKGVSVKSFLQAEQKKVVGDGGFSHHPEKICRKA
jgi:hypothetical protein